MKKNILETLKNRRLYFDGGTGTVLQSMGLPTGTPPESLTLTRPDTVRELHERYILSGANIIKTNTFGVSSQKYENYAEYIERAIALAKEAVGDREDCFIAYDVGPLGAMLAPLGRLAFEDAVRIFSDGMRVAARAGADLVLIETMTDSYETKAAVLAAKECSELPIFVTNVYDESTRLLTGATPEAMVAMLEGLGVSALGANCSLGPEGLMPAVKRLLDVASVPVIVNPNAGLPTVVDGAPAFDLTAEQFSERMREIAELGVCVLGGCCGTTPEYIKETVEKTADIPYRLPSDKGICAVSSFARALRLGDRPIIIGERINPTGKPRLKEALLTGNLSYVIEEALGQAERGADALDVNVGLAGIDEVKTLRCVVERIQAVSELPLQLDSNNPEALEAAMRVYNGKPLVNSVNGKEESLRKVLPLVKKYGGVLLALTMDEDGIQADAAGRVRIAEKILREAEKYGIAKKDIIFDPLALAVSSDKNAPTVTLSALRILRDRGLMTVLGVSNVSFGLPERDRITSAFLTLALESGLTAAIMNPYSDRQMSALRAYLALSGLDEGCADYIAFANGGVCAEVSHTASEVNTLGSAIAKGLSDRAAALAGDALSALAPLEIINGEIVPALTAVGKSFELGKIYLPQLLMSAEAAVAALDIVKRKIPKGSLGGKKIILATVRGDIHDIGKNIVKLLLESHGYVIVDLGRDVPPEKILAAARDEGAGLVGLSALMTTTLLAMEESVKLLRAELPDVKIMVGGAVLTAEYAEKIGADYYAEDAMAAVKCAEKVFKAAKQQPRKYQ